MAQTIVDSSFKVQTEVVKTRNGTRPEAGAIIFELATNSFLAGDGFTWNEMGAAAVAKSKLATRLVTPVVTPVVATVETLAPLYDTIVYNLLTGFTPATGNQITMNKDMTFDFSASFGISCNVPVVTVQLITYLDAVEANRLTYITGQTGVNLPIIALGSIPVLNTNVLTLKILTNKSCNLTTNYANMGLAEV